jgi:hypothetical protein
VIALDAEEIRATYYAVSAFDRGRALAGRPVPPSVRALLDRLDLAIRCPVSSTRHEMYGGRGELEEEWIGTALAAKVLNWHPRRVQRRAADLDGKLVGGRLVFPAGAVEAYREASQQKGISK